jgi:hypothetical protein
MDTLFTNSKEVKALIKMLIRAAKNYHFDGFVIEIWPQVQGDFDYNPLIHLVRAIGILCKG